MITQTLELMNITLATPLVVTLTEDFVTLFPAAKEVKAEQVIVRDVFVLLKIVTTSPDEKVLEGTVIVPFALDCSTNLPTSTVDSVWLCVVYIVVCVVVVCVVCDCAAF